MELCKFFPFWDKLSLSQQEKLQKSVARRQVSAGKIVHNGQDDCVGLISVISGLMRAYIFSDEGREITLYRLLPLDTCLFSASCIMNSIQFDITVSAELDTEIFLIPSAVYQELMEESADVANFTSGLMANRFSDVMWLLDQILYKKLDSRLAAFILEEKKFFENNEIKLTHEAIANHIGSAREVVSRMLKYFASEGLVNISRGSIEIVNEDKLITLAGQSLR